MARAHKVSVVLLTYNHEAYVGRAIESVLAQDADFDLIITEDRSTDRTGEIVEAAAAAHPDRIRLIRSEANLNTNKVTTRAIDMAKGEYVAFLDGDDYWTSPSKLSKQAAMLDARPELAIVFCDAEIVDSVGRTTKASFLATAPAPVVGTYTDIAASVYIAGPTAMIRKSAIAALPAWFEHAEFGDWPLYLLAAERGDIGLMPEVMAAYRVHEGGYWSGMAPDEQSRRAIRFLRFMRTVAAPERTAALNRALAEITSRLLVEQVRGRRLFGLFRTSAGLLPLVLSGAPVRAGLAKARSY
jgi:glycosyltransferase involved in cell wall biosynthesis